MGNLFAGLASGNNALSYYRRGIETAGHNIANADREGFSRQRVNAKESTPTREGNLLVGNGMTTESITRIRDLFLDSQYRAQMPALGYWEARDGNIKALEKYTGELDRSTFRNALDDYWAKLENMHIYPQEASSRETLIESTKKMITQLTQMGQRHDAYRIDLNDKLKDMVKEANKLIDDIALICKDISAAQGRGEHPNDLLDKRDLMAERLCKLTGATVGSPSLDESDSDYKIDLHGKMLVQGGAIMNCKGTEIKNTRHLELVPMVGNNSYYDVQVEDNIYDHISDLSVASVIIERGTSVPGTCSRNSVHELFVERLANGGTWQVGGAEGRLDGGLRLDTIYSKTEALGIDGSFSLQVGTAGVQVSTKSYATSIPATNGRILTAPVGSDPTEHEFRIAAGESENYIRMAYNSSTNVWDITSTSGGGVTGLGSSTTNNLTVDDLQTALATLTADYVITPESSGGVVHRFSIEAANTNAMRGHLLSITDIRGTLASDMGIANKNPSVEIKVTKEDTLTTIANRINGAYRSELTKGATPAYSTNPPETAPSKPEEWLHANVIKEPNGSFYIALTSNVSGEANRINVMPGSVCGANGDFSIARLLGFSGADSSTSYMKLDTAPDAATTIGKGADRYVDDAYFIYDNRHYLSESNSFAEARIFKTTDASGGLLRWDNPKADELGRFGRGIRLNLHGLNRLYEDNGARSANEATIIKVYPHLQSGEIYATLESRDDMILGFKDYFD